MARFMRVARSKHEYILIFNGVTFRIPNIKLRAISLRRPVALFNGGNTWTDVTNFFE